MGVLVGNPTFVDLKVADDVRHYSITDSTLEDDGEYTYSLKITYIDPLAGWVMSRVNRLVESSKALHGYYNECSIPDRLDPITGKYSEGAAKDLRVLLDTRYKKAIVALFKSMSELGLIENDNFQQSVDAVIWVLHPATGSPTEIGTLLTDIDAAIQYVLLMLGKDNPTAPNFSSTNSTNAVASGGSTGSSSNRFQIMDFPIAGTVKIERSTKKSYVNYLNVSGDGAVSRRTFRDRVQAEISRLFTSTTANLTYRGNVLGRAESDSVQTSAYGYLAPASIKMGHRKQYDIMDSQDSDLFNQLFVDALTTETTNEPELDLFTPSKDVKLTFTQQSLKNQLVMAFASIGATVEFQGESEPVAKQLRDTTMTKAQDITVAGRFVGSSKTKNNVAQPGSKDAQANGPLMSLLCLDNIELNKYTIKNYDLSSESVRSKIIARYPNPKERSSVISSLPNHVKFLFKRRDGDPVAVTNDIFDDDDFMRDPTRFFYVWHTVCNIRELVKLVGYEKAADGTTILNSPKYITITARDMDSDELVFCVARPYENSFFGIVEEPKLKLPVANEHFVLSGR